MSEKEKALDSMLHTFGQLMRLSPKFHAQVEEFTQIQSQKSLSAMLNTFSTFSEHILDLSAKAEHFQAEAIFSNNAQLSILEPIRTEKLGKYEHGIIQQIQKFDNELGNNMMSYTSYNATLSKRISQFDSMIDECIAYASQKL